TVSKPLCSFSPETQGPESLGRPGNSVESCKSLEPPAARRRASLARRDLSEADCTPARRIPSARTGDTMKFPSRVYRRIAPAIWHMAEAAWPKRGVQTPEGPVSPARNTPSQGTSAPHLPRAKASLPSPFGFQDKRRPAARGPRDSKVVLCRRG